MENVICLGKPSLIVDDNPTIRPEGRMKIKTPKFLPPDRNEINQMIENTKKICKWRCAYCGTEHKHSIRPIKCSCRNGYVKHIKLRYAI